MRTPPKNIPPVPEGFEYYGEGPLKHPSEIPSKDVATLLVKDQWGNVSYGDSHGNFYALRIGSEIHRKNMPLKIEAGKYYRTRNGEVVGPMWKGRPNPVHPEFRFRTEGGNPEVWRKDGRWAVLGEHTRDLVEEVPAPYHEEIPLPAPPTVCPVCHRGGRFLWRSADSHEWACDECRREALKDEVGSVFAELRAVIEVGRIALEAARKERDEARMELASIREKLAELLNSPIDTPTPKH